MDVWNNVFKVPVPIGKQKEKAVREAHNFFQHIEALAKADDFSFV